MEKNTKTAIAGATSAAILAGGVLVYTIVDGDNSSIDWSKYQLDVPTLNVPTLGMQKLNVVKLDVPTLTGVSLNNYSINTYGVNTYGVNSYSIDSYTSISLASLNVESLSMPDEDLPEYTKFIKELGEVFVDQRNINSDAQLNANMLNNTVIKQWISIYKKYKDAKNIAYIPVSNPFRMITEVSPVYTEKQLKILNENLNFYKNRGYDSVLVVFTKDNQALEVEQTIKYIKKYHNMNVWLAYSGGERISESVFMNVDEYTNVLTKCAPYLTGYVNSWRRTSVHLWKQDVAFMNYTNTVLRQANSNIAILGELYYGETASGLGYKIGWDTNMVDNNSAIVLSNIGYLNVNYEYLFTKLLPKITQNKQLPYVGMVIGSKPYYRELPSYKGYLDMLEVKKDLENNFLQNGCVGTITLSNDGKNDGKNDLTTTLYNTL